MLYASGNCTQIVLFATLAIQLKRRAPSVHTYLELIRLRFGVLPHLTYIFFALACNILVCSSILLGGSAAINAITGANVYALLFILPATVVAYTLRGGLRSTILADYLHTVIIFVIILVLFLRTYTTFPEIGSPSKMYDLLLEASRRSPVEGNYAGSLLTLKTSGGVQFAWLSFFEYVSVVLLDSSYHQKGIAASPDAALPGYLIGGLAWFSIPFCLASTAGLAALALEQTSPAFPTYPNRMPKADVSAGLVLPYAAQAVLGKGGAAGVLLLMFMSCTSAISAQMVGVSTVVSYDIYKTYFAPRTRAEALLRVNQIVVVAFALVAAAIGSLFHGVGLDLGLIYNLTGIFTGAGLSPLVFIFFDHRLHPLVVFPGIWINFASGVAVWLGVAYHKYGYVNLESVGGLTPCLAGCGTGIGVGLVLSILSTLFFPRPFDWNQIPVLLKAQSDAEEKQAEIIEEDPRYDADRLRRALIKALIAGLTCFLVITIIWPFSLYRDYIFSRSFFSGWVIVSFIWAVFAFVAVGIYPLWEGIPQFKQILRGLNAYAHGRRFDEGKHEDQGKHILESDSPPNGAMWTKGSSGDASPTGTPPEKAMVSLA